MLKTSFIHFLLNGNEWKKCKEDNLTMFKTVSKMSRTVWFYEFKFPKEKKTRKVTDFTLTIF